MHHKLPEIPYAYDALEPYIDAQTMELHHTKHHQTYIDKLHAAINDHEAICELSAESLVRNLDDVPEAIRTAVRNHGGGHANHSFFWPILKKGVAPGGPAVDAITRQFGSFNKFKDGFAPGESIPLGSIPANGAGASKLRNSSTSVPFRSFRR